MTQFFNDHGNMHIIKYLLLLKYKRLLSLFLRCYFVVAISLKKLFFPIGEMVIKGKIIVIH